MVLSCVELQIADDPAAWAALGFAVDDGVARVGQVDLRFVGEGEGDGAHGGPGRGIVGWTLGTAATPDGPDRPAGPDDLARGDGLDGADDLARGDGLDDGLDDVRDLDGLPTRLVPVGTHGPRPPGAHPNGVIQIDHVVVVTPDLDRTTEALGAIGVEARRTREAGHGRLQRFFRLGEVILELVGPALPRDRGERRPAAFFGLALTSADLDGTVAHLEGRIGHAKAAVQPGRRIATLRTGDDVSVPIAVMSPEPRRAADGDPRSGR